MSTSPYVIVGGSKGIGLALTQQLIDSGNEVLSIARSAEHAAGAKHLQHDIMDGPIPEEMLPESIAGLAYCPGSIELKPLRGIKEDAMREAFEVNVMGAFRCIQQCAPRLKKEPASGIVLFSTVAVQRGMTFHATVASAKGAIEGLTKSLAAEFAPAIRVNCVAPSLTRTNLAEKLLNTEAKVASAAARHPMKRVGEPNDVASLAAFLLGPDATWMTGQIIGVDGGLGAI